VDLSPFGIRVNAVAPGWIETDLSRYALAGDPERKQRILKRTPLGRLGTLEDVGWAAVYLCSPAARYVNGVILPVDGGMLAGF
jgi:NAD(P)-dependent dehydrogenase (short-subunit alcohol dehydrogenase family)